ncbi:MAG: serine/threonine-protein kinase [Planctomycetota bacterium]|jgi:serine/threonine-protein kinase
MLREGDRISNYLLEAKLGIGSFGEVWRARHHVFDDRVAIKVPTDPQYVRNLQHEGIAIHGLRHPNIVRAIDMDPYGDPPYLIMELVEGPSLRDVINRYGTALPIPSAVTILSGLLTALHVAHEQGVIHRDIKPANILLAHPIESMATIDIDAVKVTDFGLGKVGGVTANTIMQSGSLTTSEGRDIAGTLAYMAPEQKEGKALDSRSDLYACGIVLFEVITGERPQGHDLPSALRSESPAYLDDVFRKSYARVESRFASANDMLAMLSVGAPAVDSPPPVPSPPARNRSVDDAHRCPGCSFRVEKDDQFCIKCGRQLVASVPRCPNQDCRAYVHTKDRFCVLCGTSLQVLKG